MTLALASADSGRELYDHFCFLTARGQVCDGDWGTDNHSNSTTWTHRILILLQEPTVSKVIST